MRRTVFGWNPLFRGASKMTECGTEPKAFVRSSQAMEISRRRLFASWIDDWRMKLCSRQPSDCKNPFWTGERSLCFSITKNRRLMQPVKIFATMLIREMGLQLLGLVRWPFLYIKMVLVFFQLPGIVINSLHLLYRWQRMWGSNLTQCT